MFSWISKIKKLAQGKKSYIVISIGILTGIAQSQGIQIPDYVWTILGGLLGITLKTGQNRVEQTTQEFIKALEEAKRSER